MARPLQASPRALRVGYDRRSKRRILASFPMQLGKWRGLYGGALHSHTGIMPPPDRACSNISLSIFSSFTKKSRESKNKNQQFDLIQADLSDSDSRHSIIAQITEKFDHIDALINNAGITEINRWFCLIEVCFANIGVSKL